MCVCESTPLQIIQKHRRFVNNTIVIIGSIYQIIVNCDILIMIIIIINLFLQINAIKSYLYYTY